MSTNTIWNNTLQQIFEIWINPEIKKRHTDGNLPDRFILKAAQILICQGKDPEIRLNGEVRAVAYLKRKDGAPMKPGEEIRENEIDYVEKVVLLDDEDPDCGYIFLMRIGKKWFLQFDFIYHKGKCNALILKAKQFLESAVFSKEKGNWSSFIDTLFSASELLARATVLSFSDQNYVEKGTHKSTHSKFNIWANLGNVKDNYRKTFNDLATARHKYRYKELEPEITTVEADSMLQTIQEMVEELEQSLKTEYYPVSKTSRK